MTWLIRELPLDGPLFEGAIGVYGEAFIRPPYQDPDRGRDVRDRLRHVHRYRPGFRGLIAVEAGAVVGMTYGYRSVGGQWWHDAVAVGLGAASADWLADAYELVEVAVDPSHQGRGIGSDLIRLLLSGRPEETCVLSTRSDSQAHELYSRLGFELIGEMAFAPGAALFRVMGKRLKA